MDKKGIWKDTANKFAVLDREKWISQLQIKQKIDKNIC